MEKDKCFYWPKTKRMLVSKLKFSLLFMCLGMFTLSALANDSVSETRNGSNRLGNEKFQDTKRLVTGVVKDELGMTVPGVTVVLKGTTIGTITQMDGVYQLEVPKDGGTLVFSFVGMENKEIVIGTSNTINCTLGTSEISLNEVAVVAYGTKKKATITGAISSVKTDDLIKMPVASVTNMLSGTMAGVSSVQLSGQPGADDATIYIRGVSNPLVLVDGVERSFAQIDPNDIENISILKDAASTAVFGVRGANGVILVTTRRGKEGKPTISLSTSCGLQVPTKLPEYANAKDFMTYRNEWFESSGNAPIYSDDLLAIYDDVNRNPLLYPDTDWLDMLYNDFAAQQKHNLNISGGSKKVRYYTSIGMFQQDGLFNGNDHLEYNGNFSFNRYNIRANVDFELTNSTQLKLNVAGRTEKRNAPQGYQKPEDFFLKIMEANPLGGAGVVDGKFILANDFYVEGGRAADDFWKRGVDNKTKNVLNLDMQLKQQLDFITKGLDIGVKGSYNSAYNHTKTRETDRPFYTPYLREDIPWDLAMGVGEGIAGTDVVLVQEGNYGPNKYSEGSSIARSFYVEAALNYKRSFGPHNVSALALYNADRKYYPKYFSDLPTGYVGFVGRATYDYKTKYMMDFSVGYNGSENFHRDRRYEYFPSLSIGWVMTEESFLKDNGIVNYLKLRASYGKVGKDNVDNVGRFLYIDDPYHFGGGYWFGGVSGGTWQSGAYEGGINDQMTSWETVYKQNLGVDMRFLDSRLSVYVDYFTEKREDILTKRKTFPQFTAFNPPVVNIGKRENKGVELSLGWKDQINDFKYSISANASYFEHIVTFMDEIPNDDNPWTLATGHLKGQPFGYKFLGFYKEGMVNNNGDAVCDVQGGIQPGDCVYADINKDGVIDPNDKIAIGKPNNPQLTAGLNMKFEYKNLSLSMGWVGATKVSRVLGPIYRIPLGQTGDRSLFQEQFDNRWTPETAETATLPRVSNNTWNSEVSDLFIKDAGYIRLKNIRLGYNVKSQTLNGLGVKKLNVFVAGQNVLTFSKLGLLDPETYTQGDPTYPIMAVYNLGLNVTF